MEQKEAIEKMTTLRNVINRLPDSDEKRTALPIVEEFLALTTKDYRPETQRVAAADSEEKE